MVWIDVLEIKGFFLFVLVFVYLVGINRFNIIKGKI